MHVLCVACQPLSTSLISVPLSQRIKASGLRLFLQTLTLCLSTCIIGKVGRGNSVEGQPQGFSWDGDAFDYVRAEGEAAKEWGFCSPGHNLATCCMYSNRHLLNWQWCRWRGSLLVPDWLNDPPIRQKPVGVRNWHVHIFESQVYLCPNHKIYSMGISYHLCRSGIYRVVEKFCWVFHHYKQ